MQLVKYVRRALPAGHLPAEEGKPGAESSAVEGESVAAGRGLSEGVH